MHTSTLVPWPDVQNAAIKRRPTRFYKLPFTERPDAAPLGTRGGVSKS